MGPCHRCLWPHMADAEAARCAGEAAIGDERDLIAAPLAVNRRCGRQHFAHAWAALGAFVSNHEDFAILIIALLHGGEASSSHSKTRAGPSNLRLAMPATFTIAPSGARLPRRPTTPPVGERGLETG